MTSTLSELQTGLEHVRARRFAQARTVFEAMLAAGSENADAFHLLGVCLIAEGRHAEALPLLEQAVRRGPDVAAYRHSAAIALAGLSRACEAEAACRETLRLDPEHLDAKLQLAELLAGRGAREEALIQYREVLRVQPAREDALLGCAVALAGLGRYAEALNSLDRLLTLRPEHVKALLNRTVVLNRLERHEEAVACIRRALKLADTQLEVHVTAAMAFVGAGKLEEAALHCHGALRLAPDDPCALGWLGRIEFERGNNEAAEELLQRALRFDPDDTSAAIELGNVLGRLGRLDDALSCFDAVIARGGHDQADVDARFNRSLILLARGEWAEGWAEYEHRWKAQRLPRPRVAAAQWDGANPEGRRIVLCSEQGLGDSIQFIRYARELATAGASVIASCQKPLIGLFAGASGVDAAVDRAEEAPECDAWASLMSLPRLFGTHTPGDVPRRVPYLFPAADLIAQWAERLPRTGRLRVGVAWAGNPNHKNDRNRSMRLSMLLPLAAVSDVDFFSLQLGAGASQVAEDWPADRMTDLAAEITPNLEHTAAAIMNLDLVISVDSALAHLAGALAKPVWVMIPYLPDWRWLLEGDESAWYPTMRLFRQPSPGDWPAVVARVAHELRERRLLPAGSC
jgi:tetratricopeptide (TPR) repeat protein